LQDPDSTKNKRSREKATDVGFLALNVRKCNQGFVPKICTVS
jgi:hypothetical protein